VLVVLVVPLLLLYVFSQLSYAVYTKQLSQRYLVETEPKAADEKLDALDRRFIAILRGPETDCCAFWRNKAADDLETAWLTNEILRKELIRQRWKHKDTY